MASRSSVAATSRGGPTADRLTVLYDAECGFCRRIAGRLAGADVDGRLRLVPLQRAGADRPEVQRVARRRDLSAALHVVDGEGDWAAGGEAMLRALERIGSLWCLVWLARLPIVSAMVEPAYRLVADNRARLSWLAGSFDAAQRVRGTQPRRPHGRIEARDGADGDRRDDAAHDGHGGHDGHPVLR